MTSVSELCFKRERQKEAGIPKVGSIIQNPLSMPFARHLHISGYRQLMIAARDGVLHEREIKQLKDWYLWIRDNPELLDPWMIDLKNAADELRGEPK